MSHGGANLNRNRKSHLEAEPFECKRCGNCCLGEGFVSVSGEDCRRIAEFLAMPLEEFLATYTRNKPGHECWLADKAGEDVPCIFFERDKKGLASCRVQDAKPEQCRTFPLKWRRPGFSEWCAGMLARESERGKDRG